MPCFVKPLRRKRGGVENIPLSDLRDIARLQEEIEDAFVPEQEGETPTQRMKKVMRRVFKRPRLSENDLLKLERFKEWARKNLFC